MFVCLCVWCGMRIGVARGIVRRDTARTNISCVIIYYRMMCEVAMASRPKKNQNSRHTPNNVQLNAVGCVHTFNCVVIWIEGDHSRPEWHAKIFKIIFNLNGKA